MPKLITYERVTSKWSMIHKSNLLLPSQDLAAITVQYTSLNITNNAISVKTLTSLYSLEDPGHSTHTRGCCLLKKGCERGRRATDLDISPSTRFCRSKLTVIPEVRRSDPTEQRGYVRIHSIWDTIPTSQPTTHWTVSHLIIHLSINFIR